MRLFIDDQIENGEHLKLHDLVLAFRLFELTWLSSSGQESADHDLNSSHRYREVFELERRDGM